MTLSVTLFDRCQIGRRFIEQSRGSCVAALLLSTLIES